MTFRTYTYSSIKTNPRRDFVPPPRYMCILIEQEGRIFCVLSGGKVRREESSSKGAKKEDSWGSLLPHYSVCSSISLCEMVKARAPLFLSMSSSSLCHPLNRDPHTATLLEPALLYSHGYYSSVTSQLPLLCHATFVYYISSVFSVVSYTVVPSLINLVTRIQDFFNVAELKYTGECGLFKYVGYMLYSL